MDRTLHTQLIFAKDRSAIFEHFLQLEIEQDATADKLAFLDQGIDHSPFQTELNHYLSSLKQKPMRFSPYPHLGQIPQIHTEALSFLHPEIQEACICLGRWKNSGIEGLWLGRNALRNTQFWSGTKMIPVLNVLSQINRLDPQAQANNWIIRHSDNPDTTLPFCPTVQDIVTYQQSIGSSNALAAMFKRFETRIGLEQWFQKITGNWELEFRGDYGEAPLIQHPEVYDLEKQQVLCSAVPETAKGNNLVSAYDLTRIISMIGWHYHLTPDCRLPGLQDNNFPCIINALSQDTARFIDAALKVLGLEEMIRSPVILSKLGHGPSNLRQTIETTYMAFFQFIDPLPKSAGKSDQLRSMAMTLRGAIPIEGLENFDQESIRLDARMAAEVTEIIRRIVTEELDEIV